MNITFPPLTESDFPLLLKWLNKTHVKTWWDEGRDWTIDAIRKKYSSYIQGYKLEAGAEKSINSYIIYIDENPIGYIQSYNAYDFPRKMPLEGLPESLAAFDIFIGEEEYIGKGIGSKVLEVFIEDIIDPKFTAVFADPDTANIAAIKAYSKAGFKKVKECATTGEIWMIKEKNNGN